MTARLELGYVVAITRNWLNAGLPEDTQRLRMQKPPQRKTTAAKLAPSNWALQDRSALAVDGTDANQEQLGSDCDAQALIDDFEASLQDDADLDQQGREFLSQQFTSAVKDAAVNVKAGSGPQRSDWLETIEALRGMGVVDEDESNTLIRQLDQALQPLQRRNVQVAIEFSRRCKEQDEQSALEWLRAATAESADAQQQAAPSPQGDHGTGGDTITKSRSRRLRGPPAG